MDIATISSVIAVIVCILTLAYTVRNSKGSIIKRIERKERQIRIIEDRFTRTYGVNANIRMHYPTYHKIELLKEDIIELEKKI